MNQSSKSLGQKDLCAANSCRKSCNSLYHTNNKVWRRICFGVGGFCQLQSCGFELSEEQIKSDHLSQHTVASHLSQHTVASHDPIWNVICGSIICTHAR